MEVKSCTLCCFKEESKVITILLPDLKIIWINHYNNLEEEINNYFNDKVFYCQNCKLLSGLRQYTIGPYLWIDTDEAYRASTYANTLNIDAANLTSKLDEVPTTIKVKLETFVLCSVVKYVPAIDEKGTGHYIALCRTSSIWIERNDLVHFMKTLPGSNLPKIKISGIFYAKCSAI